jgi:hypothetical protein
MPNPTKLIVDCSTGITTEIELNDEEVAQRDIEIAELEKYKALEKAEAETKAEVKASAEAKLAALGLTAEEIAAL